MRLAILALLLPLLCLAAGFYFHYLHAPAAPLPRLGAAPERASLALGGRQRGYLRYVPRNLPPHAPLLLVLHGSGQDGARIRAWTAYAFDRLADQRGYAVVYPDGYHGGWNDCRRHGGTPAKDEDVDDVGFLHALVGRMVEALQVDPARVLAMGYSNGGQMGFRLLAQDPTLLAGLAVAGASLPVPENNLCGPGAGAPLMMVSGTADPIVPYEGGEVSLFGFSKRGRVLPAVASAEEFARQAGASPGPASLLPPPQAADGTRVELRTWQREGRTRIAFYTVHGGGHVVPQAGFRYPRLLGRTTRAFDMPGAVADFFGL